MPGLGVAMHPGKICAYGYVCGRGKIVCGTANSPSVNNTHLHI